MRQSRKVGRVAGGDGRHRVAVDVDAVAVARMGLVHRLRHGRVVRAPAGVYALAHLFDRQLPVVDRQALVGQLPDQALAQAHLRQHARVGGDGAVHSSVEHRGVDLGGVAVGVEVAARKVRLDPGHAQLGCEVVELLDVRVLGPPQRGQLAAPCRKSSG
jgi:hypothetical protein